VDKQELEYIASQGDFIHKHIGEDPFKLFLKFARQADKKLLVEQIQARQKIKKKLPEWYANFKLIFPPSLSLEQSSSEATARLKSSLIKGDNLLDITGGMGIDAYYLSKSFTHCTYVEKNATLALIAKHNFEALNTSIKVLQGDGVEALVNSLADFVYIDPYRRDDAKNKVVSLEDCLPNVIPLTQSLVRNGRKSLIKTSPMLDINLAIEQLCFVSEVWVISHKNDCKEVLFLLEEKPESIEIKTFDIYPYGDNAFAFKRNEIENSKPLIAIPQVYLYEPNASVLKAGGQDVLANRHKLKKLHPNSNFYTSEEPVSHYPGKTFKIKALHKPFDKSLAKGRFNVISRNFPQKANEIEDRLKLKPAKNEYLIATQLKDASYTFIVCELQMPTG
jgi:hypothetical protein